MRKKLALARQTAHGCHTRSSNWFRLLGGNTCVLEGYQCVSWEGGELETKSMWTKYL